MDLEVVQFSNMYVFISFFFFWTARGYYLFWILSCLVGGSIFINWILFFPFEKREAKEYFSLNEILNSERLLGRKTKFKRESTTGSEILMRPSLHPNSRKQNSALQLSSNVKRTASVLYWKCILNLRIDFEQIPLQ